MDQDVGNDRRARGFETAARCVITGRQFMEFSAAREGSHQRVSSFSLCCKVLVSGMGYSAKRGRMDGHIEEVIGQTDSHRAACELHIKPAVQQLANH